MSKKTEFSPSRIAYLVNKMKNPGYTKTSDAREIARMTGNPRKLGLDDINIFQATVPTEQRWYGQNDTALEAYRQAIIAAGNRSAVVDTVGNVATKVGEVAVITGLVTAGLILGGD